MNPLILFEDDDIIVANKPAGMLSQVDSTGRESLSGLIKEYIKGKIPGNEEPYAPALHRLDRPVSGVMLFAKNPVAAGRLSDDIRYKRVKKFYCAVVSPASGYNADREWIELKQFIVRRRDRGSIAAENDPGAEPVSLKYRIFNKSGNSALMLVELITGKRHQIRVQLSSIGSPIIGDRFYGSQEVLPAEIIALHAHYLCLTHPMSGDEMIFSAPLPGYMMERIYCTPQLEDYTDQIITPSN